MRRSAASLVPIGHQPSLCGGHARRAIGPLDAWLARIAEGGSQLWCVGLVEFIIVSFHMIGIVQLLAVPGAAFIADTRGRVSGIFSGLAMITYILHSHSNVRRMMGTREE